MRRILCCHNGRLMQSSVSLVGPVEQGSSEIDSRSNVYDSLEFKIIYN